MSSDFRRHWSIDPDITFLNHGSFGATPTAVLEHQRELQAQLEHQPLRFYLRDLEELWGGAMERAAEFIGASVETFAFVTNASTGVNTVLRSLDFSPGDELLVTDHEYNACRNALDFVATRSGATVRVVNVPFEVDGPDAIVAAIAESITDRTRLLLIDYVTSQTAVVMPVEAITDLCREHGVEVLVDAAHAPGMVDLDVSSLGADYCTGNFHKWGCTPKAAAFLTVAPRHLGKIRPLVISHGANAPVQDVAERFQREFGWQGTIDPTPFVAIPFGLDYMASLVDGGWPEIRLRNHQLVVDGRRMLLERFGGDEPVPDDMLGSTAAVRLQDSHVDPLPGIVPLDRDQKALYELGVEVPIIAWPSRPKRLLRISAQLYNSLDDFARLADAMEEVGIA